MELIEIVDKYGNKTGEILDKEIAHDRNLLHNEVAVFIVNKNGDVLLQKRSANKRFHPGKWALCAGHVDAYESLESAAIREVKEEVGLEIKKSELIPFFGSEITLDNTNSHITYFYYTFSEKQSCEFNVQIEELSEVKWFKIKDVIEMINSKNTLIVFNKKRLAVFEQLSEIVLK